MKKILLILMCTFALQLQAQEGVAINNDGSAPDGSAILDLKSTTKGILIPRMTESQRTLISNVATGLLVYQTDGTSGFYFYNGSAWVSLSGTSNTLDGVYDGGGTGAGRSIDAVDGTVAINGEDGLVVTGTLGSGLGVGAPNGIPEGPGTRMFFNPGKAAFRAGSVNGTEWDDFNIGLFSVALGNSTIALRENSTAMGFVTRASGVNSTAMGFSTVASGERSTAMGQNSIASGENSIAMGEYTTASGINSLAMGVNTTASGYVSTTMGFETSASGFSTAMGRYTIASGINSTAMGLFTTAPSFSETVIGAFNNDYFPANTTAWNAADRLFVVGNGTGTGQNASNALTIYKSGKMNINDAYDMPVVDGTAGQVMTTDGAGVVSFQTPGADQSNTLNEAYDEGGAGAGRTIDAVDGTVAINGEDGLVVTGTFGSGLAIGDAGSIPEGPGTRMFFNPNKAAFRAGYVDDTQWDNANVGLNSTAMGTKTTASGNYSTAMGYNITASGGASTAMGFHTTASGDVSTAMGHNTTASGNYATASGNYSTALGNYATAMGYNTTASGVISTAMGLSTAAWSYLETVIGSWNTAYTPASTTEWNSADRLFVVGNGTGIGAKSNALIIYKNGTMNINDAYDMPTEDGTPGQVLTTDGAGVVSFQAPGAVQGNTLDEAYDQGGAGAGRTIDAVDGTVAINGEDGLVVTGIYGSGLAIGDAGAIPQGAGTRMFFNPNKAAFRAGGVTGTRWDNANIGNYSTAMGINTRASGSTSTAMGSGTTASGSASTAMGQATSASGIRSTAMGGFTNASGDHSTAMGFQTTASGEFSTAMGQYTTASGFRSTAMGGFTNAPSYGETAIGSYNTSYVPAMTSGWDASDRLFVVGNGTGLGAESDALVILKNGNVGIGTSSPSTKLDVEGVLELSSVVPTDPGSDIVRLGDGGENLHIQTNYGYTRIGPQNTSWSHFITDRSRYYFDKGITVNQGLIGSYDEDLSIQTAGATRMTISNSNGNVGIGDATPDGKLEVRQTAAADIFNLYDNTTNVLSVQDGGNVGIGTSSPNSKLNVNNPSTATGAHFRVQDDGITQFCIANNGNTALYFNNAPDHKLELNVNDAAKPFSSAWTVTSDARLKTNVTTFGDGLNVLMQINPVWFEYNGKAGMPTNERGVGTIAQELKKIAPYMVNEWTYTEGSLDENAPETNEPRAKTKYLGVDYGAMDFVIINSVQEQQAIIESQKAEIDALKVQMTQMQKTLDVLTNK